MIKGYRFVFTVVMLGCSQILSPGGRSSYQEDLSSLIPEIDETEYNTSFSNEQFRSPRDSMNIEPMTDITYQLDSLLDSIASNDQKKRYIQGYTIQVYTGSSRSEARDSQTRVYRILPGSRPTINYDLPNYKVKVGKFLHRIQAQKDFAEIKGQFPNAILVPQQFVIDN